MLVIVVIVVGLAGLISVAVRTRRHSGRVTVPGGASGEES